ncbi:GntR family transcriptional regulator [Acidiferrimicrobium sp. IK]|uniref:GntR family transcriptional regulator n=1 Tax=Acidiferrimicrobium sp. IK TaxID=2871700 RepID=UPI0021CAFCE9|nr:GntR family transcriptional regulator [Acidiferrimicrobium sp. IK]MCU4184225.1 GntR family transcriptional regulator [Acidiferrimicrobium sp. IK]
MKDAAQQVPAAPEDTAPGNGDAANDPTSEVVEAIRRAILEGEYAPRERLVEAELSKRFSASRFSARVALQQLAFEGLVELQRNRGASVRAVSIPEAIEITQVRAVLEGFCAARAAELASDEEIVALQETTAAMRRAVDEGAMMTYSGLNAKLHSQIRTIAANPTCARLLEQMRAQMVRHQFVLALQPGRPSVSVNQHIAVVNAIAARDSDAASRAMHEHLASVLSTLQSLPHSRVH